MRSNMYANPGKKGKFGIFRNVKWKMMNKHLYILREYAKMSPVALYPSQSAPVSKKGLKIL